MNDCERYRSDPEADPAHPDSCEACRALGVELERIDQSIGSLSVDPKPTLRERLSAELPLAPWEGARYRSWGLAVTVLVTLLVLAAGAFLAVGVSPLRAMRALRSTMLPLISPLELAESFSALVASAPVMFHVTIGVLFVLVNLVLLFLLRRPPRGYDA